MRILIVSDVSSWMRGGVPAETLALVQGLVERGHVLALASDAPLPGAEAALHVPMTWPIGTSLQSEIRAALASFAPDFVHVICMNSRGVFALSSALEAYPWALTVHSVPPYENKLRGWHESDKLHYRLRDLRYLPNSLAWRYICTSARVPRVIVHSAFVEEIVVRYGYPSRQVMLIPLFVRPEGQGAARGSGLRCASAPLLLTVGGLTHTKGQHDVVATLPWLLERYPGLRYEMVGEVRDDTYVRHLRRLADELGVSEHVLISPNLDRKAMNETRAQADVYVQPSHEEGFCLAYAEAAEWIPRLVGTATGAIAEMSRDDRGASVVRVRQPAALGRAVAEQLSQPLPTDHMPERMRRLAERFAFADYISAHENLYTGRIVP